MKTKYFLVSNLLYFAIGISILALTDFSLITKSLCIITLIIVSGILKEYVFKIKESNTDIIVNLLTGNSKNR
ncbi:hypothetical protein [Mammaliicoccus vitulinus]|uniref:hypothetical protein n=1 Tax=Mammaliicoccus vitulinus TaxID=71237 RepID=UPI003B9E6342